MTPIQLPSQIKPVILPTFQSKAVLPHASISLGRQTAFRLIVALSRPQESMATSTHTSAIETGVTLSRQKKLIQAAPSGFDRFGRRLSSSLEQISTPEASLSKGCKVPNRAIYKKNHRYPSKVRIQPCVLGPAQPDVQADVIAFRKTRSNRGSDTSENWKSPPRPIK
jgi:hypothetical protein